MNIKTILAFIIVAISAGAFCNAEKQTTASVTPVAKASPMKYNPMIFGHFIEHFDNQVYGGLYWPGSPFSDEDGFRKDVIKALREIKPKIVS